MELQLLTQTYAPNENIFIKDNRQEDMYAQYSKGGILLFLKVTDILNSNIRFVYFMVYSMSPKITIYWGVFDKEMDEFIFDSGCIGNLKSLNNMLTNWKKHGYQYTANIVQNQIKPLINKYTNKKVPKGKIDFNYSLYSLFKNVINNIKNSSKIDNDDLIKFKIVIFDTYIKDPEFHYTNDEVEDIIRLYETQIDKVFIIREKDIETQLKEYEKNINMINIDNSLSRQIKELKRITDIFYNKIKHGEYFYYNRVTDICPNIDECNIKNKNLCGAYDYGYTISYIEDLL